MNSLKKILCLLIIYLFNCFPIKKNKIFLFSYYGSQYGCNPKYITEYMIENGYQDKYDIVWAFNDLESKEHLTGIRKVKTMSIKYFYELCTAKVIITNFRTTDFFVKRKNQYYIQTWHSSLRLKQIEKDAEKSLPQSYVQMAKKDSLKVDLLLSGCRYSTDIFKRSFWYKGKIFEIGTPRNDLLFNNVATMKKLRESLNIPIENKVVFYAPTFRKNNDTTVYNLNYSKLLSSLKSKFDGEWTVLIKLHPHLISLSDKLIKEDKLVIDVTSYDDTQELLAISDVLISDYSSLMFDFCITNRPCFLYVPDMEDYIKNDRNLYFDLNELPFESAISNEDLSNKIKNFNYDLYNKNLKDFLQDIGSFENGNASEHLLEHIHDVCFSRNRSDIYEAV